MTSQNVPGGHGVHGDSLVCIPVTEKKPASHTDSLPEPNH